MKHKIFVYYVLMSCIIPSLRAMERSEENARHKRTYESAFPDKENYEQKEETHKRSHLSASCLCEQADDYMGMAKNSFKQAVILYKQAAKQGNSQAQYTLAILYDKGYLAYKSIDKSMHLYRLASNQKHPGALYKIGNHHYSIALKEEEFQQSSNTEDDLPEDYHYLQARQYFSQAASQNHPGAQYKLGRLIWEGKGGGQDDNEALKLFHQAAAQNNKKALMFLAGEYDEGTNIPQDHVKSTEIKQILAQSGAPDWQLELGHSYRYGYGVEQDLKKAAELYCAAGLQGLYEALSSHLKQMYKYGYGVAQDLAKASQLKDKNEALWKAFHHNDIFS